MAISACAKNPARGARAVGVVRNRLGELEGIEAVVDKDSITGLLATERAAVPALARGAARVRAALPPERQEQIDQEERSRPTAERPYAPEPEKGTVLGIAQDPGSCTREISAVAGPGFFALAQGRRGKLPRDSGGDSQHRAAE